MKTQCKLILGSLILTLCSCSGSSAPVDPAPTEAVKSNSNLELDLMLSRASLQGVEFEQFKLFNGKLYKECGQIKRGRFAPADQSLLSPSPGSYNQLVEQVEGLRAFLAEQKVTLPEPGNNRTFADPGQVVLNIKSDQGSREIKTSLDGISNQGDRAQTKIKRIVEMLRGEAGGELCGNQVFYGLGATKHS